MRRESWKKLWPFLKDPVTDGRNIRLEGERIVLRSKRMEDAEADYRWRVDPELATLDATRPITITLREYMRYHRDDLQFPSPRSVRLAIDTLDGHHIGNCMYYDVDTELHQAEFGIMIGESNYWSSGYGSDAVRTMLLHIFTSTWLRRIYLHTLVTNARAQRAFEKAGFEVDKQVRKDGFDFIRMHITRERWEELNADLLDSIDEKSQAEEAELDTQPAGRASVVEG
jgi:RimJ/RimL family protein N-acetyltransferase